MRHGDEGEQQVNSSSCIHQTFYVQMFLVILHFSVCGIINHSTAVFLMHNKITALKPFQAQKQETMQKKKILYILVQGCGLVFVLLAVML